MAEEEKPTANPAALGLIGFGMTTVVLSLFNAGVFPGGALPVVVIMALVYGGTTQWVAGIFEFKCGNNFRHGSVHVIRRILGMVRPAGTSGEYACDRHVTSRSGSRLVADRLGIFTLYMWVPTFRLNLALWLVFLTLWITYFLLGAGGLTGSTILTTAGGIIGIICGVIAVYTAFATVTNETVGATWLPVVPLGK